MSNTKKLYDLVVKTGSYMDGREEKGVYKNVGAAMQNDDGTFLVLDRTFNFAGVPNPDNRDSVVVSCFEPKEKESNSKSRNGM